jgi:hypothetical protein
VELQRVSFIFIWLNKGEKIKLAKITKNMLLFEVGGAFYGLTKMALKF